MPEGEDAADFAYTSLSGTAFTEVIPDLTAFGEMDMALVASNILSADERAAVYDTLAALLHLGNVQLDVDEQDVCSVTAATRAHLAKAEELLGIGEIGNVLIERVLRTPRTGTEYHIALDKTAAVNQRDAFVKFIYSSLFLLIVTRMNAKLDASAKRTHSRIGLLDVFGFEIFPTNSFEQLCINYANEKLHNFFLMRVFDVEIELYKMQNLPIDVKTLSYPDNAKVIELLEKPPASIFSILESQCKMAKSSDLHFCAALHEQLTKHPQFATLSSSKIKLAKDSKLKDEDSFVVKHYAAAVCYSCAGFLEKNSDTLSEQFQSKLAASSRSLVKEIADAEKVEEKIKADRGMMSARGAARASASARGAPGGAGDGGQEVPDVAPSADERGGGDAPVLCALHQAKHVARARRLQRRARAPPVQLHGDDRMRQADAGRLPVARAVRGPALALQGVAARRVWYDAERSVRRPAAGGVRRQGGRLPARPGHGLLQGVQGRDAGRADAHSEGRDRLADRRTVEQERRPPRQGVEGRARPVH